MHIEVPSVSSETLRKGNAGGEESSNTIAQRVPQAQRDSKRQGHPNHLLSTSQIKQHCEISADDHTLLENAIEKLGLSHRAYHRILRVSRTIADIGGETGIQRHHLT
jgi:magnesium chelatase family protein